MEVEDESGDVRSGESGASIWDGFGECRQQLEDVVSQLRKADEEEKEMLRLEMKSLKLAGEQLQKQLGEQEAENKKLNKKLDEKISKEGKHKAEIEKLRESVQHLRQEAERREKENKKLTLWNTMLVKLLDGCSKATEESMVRMEEVERSINDII